VTARILVAGIGNIFMSDDGFGVEVARELLGREWPAGVDVGEYGIRGVHLAYQLLDGYGILVLVDAVPMGERPGTLAVLELDPQRSRRAEGVVDAHTMSPDIVLATLGHLGGTLERAYVVGCQPADIREGIGLSAEVAAAVTMAADLCTVLVRDILQPVGKGTKA
jgi:hydrogenase maturation protease